MQQFEILLNKKKNRFSIDIKCDLAEIEGKNMTNFYPITTFVCQWNTGNNKYLPKVPFIYSVNIIFIWNWTKRSKETHFLANWNGSLENYRITFDTSRYV